MNPFKKAVRAGVSMLGLEVHLKYLPIMQPFWHWKHRERFDTIAQSMSFYSRLLRGKRLKCIFDVGANVGDKAKVFKEFADLVVCIEPDPLSAKALRVRYGDEITVEEVAVGEREEQLLLYQKHGLSTMNTLDKKLSDHWGDNARGVQVTVTTLDKLIQKHGKPDFIKLDVEGFELQVFSGLTTVAPPCCFEAFLPMFFDQTVQIVNRLAGDDVGQRKPFNATNLDSDNFIFPTCVSADELLSWLGVQNAEASKNNFNLAYDIFYLPNSVDGVPSIA